MAGAWLTQKTQSMTPHCSLGDALEIALRVLRHGHDDGQREEQVRRNEERREVREVEADERVLHGNRDVERDDERIVVGGLRRRDRDELPQQEEADEREEDEKRGLAEREGDREDDDGATRTCARGH